MTIKRGKGRPKTIERDGAAPGAGRSAKELLAGVSVADLGAGLSVRPGAVLTWAARIAAENLAPMETDPLAQEEAIVRILAQIEGGLLRAGRRTEEIDPPLEAFAEALHANIALIKAAEK